MSDTSTIIGLILAVAGGSSLLASDLEPTHLAARTPLAVAGSTLAPDRGPDGRLYLDGAINGLPITFMLDTAANRTLISETDARALGVRITGQIEVRTVGGIVSAYEGEARSLGVGSSVLAENPTLLIVPNLPHPLLGMDMIQAFGSSSITL